MKLTSIQEVIAQDEDTPVLGVQGRIVTIYDPREKHGGPESTDYWKFQHLVIQDPSDTDQAIKVTLVKRETLGREWKGELIHFASAKGKNGWTGVKVKLDKYVDKMTGKEIQTKVLWVTATAQISKGYRNDEAEAKADLDEQLLGPQHVGKPETVKADHPKVFSPRENLEQGDLLKSRKIVARSGNLWGLAMRAAIFHVSQIEQPNIRDGFLANGIALQAAAATIMISADKAGAALGMPSGNIYPERKPGESYDPSDNDGGGNV